MRTARFASQFVYPLADDGTSTIYPAGWSGGVSDEVAAAMIKAGRAGELDPLKKVKAAGPDPTKVDIPEGWRDLKADELVKLARDLGASTAVNRKDEALEFIGKIEAERAKSQ